MEDEWREREREIVLVSLGWGGGGDIVTGQSWVAVIDIGQQVAQLL